MRVEAPAIHNSATVPHFEAPHVAPPVHETANVAPNHPDHDSVPHSPKPSPSWAKPETGWQEKSHKDLSGFEKLKYIFGGLGTKVQALLNAIRQGLTPNSKKSQKILIDATQVEGIDDQAMKSGAGRAPSATVKKLVDTEGPRTARLGQSDLINIAQSFLPGKVHFIDTGVQNGGDKFKNVAERKPSEKLENPTAGKITMMPFVLPAHKGSEEHVVLISVDPKSKEIRYFDPKGAYSDDPSHLGAFKDNPNFNMRTDLETLKGKLGKRWTIKENIKAYQRDVTNCGTYVALAMQDEAKGKAVGQDWQTGLTWVNGQKAELAQNMWNHYKANYLK